LKVAVLDADKKILAPTRPQRARVLLKRGKAAVYRRYPFTIILKRAVEDVRTPDLVLKIDPGSKKTGIAIVNQKTGEIVFAAEIEHRGEMIKKKLDTRRAVRRNRRNRKTRYRKPRFLNRRRPKGWLPPSLESCVANIETWVRRLSRFYPIAGLALELVKFDTQLMENPEIGGIEYQQGELAGYEVREYLLEKWGRKCAYCGASNIPLQIEHIIPKSRGGTDRVSNLTLACETCNQKKGKRTAAEFGFPQIEKRGKRPLKDAAAVNATRWRLFERLKSFGLPVETASGGLTKFNRTKRGLPKAHWIDAACVGKSTPERIGVEDVYVYRIKATGHNSRRMRRVDKYGFPCALAKGARTVKGFRTGDIVQAEMPNGKHAGRYTGRVAIRERGVFRLTTVRGSFDVNHRYCRLIQRADGYSVS
jgi:5-methylcytosine-specific restriction endonuclease McrA